MLVNRLFPGLLIMMCIKHILPTKKPRKQIKLSRYKHHRNYSPLPLSALPAVVSILGFSVMAAMISQLFTQCGDSPLTSGRYSWHKANRLRLLNCQDTIIFTLWIINENAIFFNRNFIVILYKIFILF